MRRYRSSRPPQAMGRARLDNVVLVPAILLPYKKQWQKTANALPKGSVLIGLPCFHRKLRSVLLASASFFQKHGREVSLVQTESFLTS